MLIWEVVVSVALRLKHARIPAVNAKPDTTLMFFISRCPLTIVGHGYLRRFAAVCQFDYATIFAS